MLVTIVAEPPLCAVTMVLHTLGSGVVSKSVPMTPVEAGGDDPVVVLETVDVLDETEVVLELDVTVELVVVVKRESGFVTGKRDSGELELAFVTSKDDHEKNWSVVSREKKLVE